MDEFILHNGVKIPSIGFGTWKLKNNEDTVGIIQNAVSSGYRLFDTAFSYGNEEAVGKGLKQSNIPREELIISSKLWNADRGYDNIIKACKRSIKALDCVYLDIYLIHWPASKAVHDNWIEINNETWKAFEYLYENNLVKAIGVCNFKTNQLIELNKEAKIKPMINQIEYHIGMNQSEIVNYCKENDIVVEAWSPLGSGKMLKNDTIKDMANKYNVSPAQLCIRWCYQNKVIPLPKSKNEERMKQNKNIMNFEISKDDMKVLDEMPYIGGSGLDSEEITIFG